MKVLFIVGSVTVVFTLFVVLVIHFASPPEDPPEPEPEIHHEASGQPREPAPFPEEPVLDYQPCEPFAWWLNDDAVDRATGVK